MNREEIMTILPHREPMLLLDDVENREFLRKLLDAMYPELPVSKKR
jgi:3-hydroxymyristoyl/3-hydroxydecanoyl-(acyl carrier protein) dehydratase